MSVGTATTTGISGNHTYARFGTATGTVHYSCFNGNSSVPQTATFQATVTDAPLTSTGATIAATTGRPFTMVVAHVADANPVGVAADFCGCCFAQKVAGPLLRFRDALAAK
jgi:hypothetical protein